MELLADPQAWIALATLTALEIVLGVDNIIFISVLVGRLPEQQRNRARVIGLALAMGTRILLLLSLAWIMTLTAPLFTLSGTEIAGRAGNSRVAGRHGRLSPYGGASDLRCGAGADRDHRYSDSVITAVGMVSEVPVMIAAIVIAVLVMMCAAKGIGDFVDNHPTIKMLALSFLIMVGMALIAEGLDFHVPKGYIYFAMAFSVAVEMLNIRMRARIDQRRAPIRLRKRLDDDGA